MWVIMDMRSTLSDKDDYNGHDQFFEPTKFVLLCMADKVYSIRLGQGLTPTNSGSVGHGLCFQLTVGSVGHGLYNFVLMGMSMLCLASTLLKPCWF